jgi:hypothetical protein
MVAKGRDTPRGAAEKAQAARGARLGARSGHPGARVIITQPTALMHGSNPCMTNLRVPSPPI